MNVNRPALDRFAQKLQQLDKTAKSKVEFDDGSFEEPGKQQMATDLDSALDAEGRGAAGGLSFDEIKKREHEITFELGGLKIKENELLIELRTLRGKSNH